MCGRCLKHLLLLWKELEWACQSVPHETIDVTILVGNSRFHAFTFKRRVMGSLLLERLPNDILCLVCLPLSKRDLCCLQIASDRLKERLNSPKLAIVWHFKHYPDYALRFMELNGEKNMSARDVWLWEYCDTKKPFRTTKTTSGFDALNVFRNHMIIRAERSCTRMHRHYDCLGQSSEIVLGYYCSFWRCLGVGLV